MTKALFVHEEAGWQITRYNPMDVLPLDWFRKSRLVQATCEPLGQVDILEAIGGGPFMNWPAGHFGTYTRCTQWRPYANPVVGCLSFLHEFRHKWTWRRGGLQMPPALDGEHELWSDWQQRMIDSELDASFLTECEIYFDLPQLREQTFKHPIWIDRYLGGKFCKPKDRLYSDDMPVEERINLARLHRQNILGGKQRSYKDWIEKAVAGYYETNMDWVTRFARERVGFGPYENLSPFRCVENHLRDADNVDAHIEWLRAVTPTRQDMERLGLRKEHQVPLGLQAKTFGDEVFIPYLKMYSNDLFFE